MWLTSTLNYRHRTPPAQTKFRIEWLIYREEREPDREADREAAREP